ncbi:MAG: hypothetical protein AAFV53_07880 [Myxococcota bacterium]
MWLLLFVSFSVAACSSDEKRGPADPPTLSPVDPRPGAFSVDFALPGLTGTSASRVAVLTEDTAGRLLVGGLFSFIGRAPSSGVAVWEDDQLVSLGEAPLGNVTSLLPLPNGGVLAGGWDEETGAGFVVRWTGTAWDVIVEDVAGGIEALYLDPSGDLVVGGGFTDIGGSDADGLARWDGTEFSALATGGPGPGSVIRHFFEREGYVLCVAGDILEFGEDPAGGVGCLSEAGWEPMGALPGTVFDVIATSDGTYIAAGSFVMSVDDGEPTIAGLAEWDGSSWQVGDFLGVSQGLINQVRDLEPMPDGGFIAAGQFGVVGTDIYLIETPTEAMNVARWDGATWSAYGAGLQESIGPTSVGVPGAWAIWGDHQGETWVGGLFHESDEALVMQLGRWDGSDWRPAVGGGGYHGQPFWVQHIVSTDSFTGFGGDLWIDGARVTMARWSEEGFVAWEGAPQGPLNALVSGADGRVWAAGSLTLGDAPTALAVWDGGSWSSALPSIEGEIADLIPTATGVWVLGPYTHQETSGVGFFDGDVLTPAASGAMPDVIMGAVAPDGTLFVHGFFDEIGGVSANGLASWDGQSWRALGDGLDGSIYAMAWWDDRLLVAGNYLQQPGDSGGRANPNPFLPVASWDGERWSSWGDIEGPFETPLITMMKVWRGGLYLGGDLTFAGGVAVQSLAWTDGATWHDIGPVDDLTEDVGGSVDAVWFAGPYRQAGGRPSFGVARRDLP